MTGTGVATVARQEFKLRIRAGRWKFLLGAWFLVLALLTVLLRVAAGTVESLSDKGIIVFGGLVVVVLGLSMLVVPSLAAQSVNGDRERGTLAALQVTRLTPADIVLGKFTAAWGTALLFLLLTVPLALFAATQGGVSVGRLGSVLVVLALLLGCVCAVALCLSALLSRTTTSGLLAYLAVAVLTIGTLIVFGLATAVTQDRYEVSYPNVQCQTEAAFNEYYGQDGMPPAPGGPLPAGCTEDVQTYETSRARTDRTWWLLSPNPFVILADAAPALPPAFEPGLSDQELQQRSRARELDPLGTIGESVRGLRRTPEPLEVVIARESTGTFEDVQPGPTRSVWPYGLAFDLAVAGLALLLATRRLRTPTRTLPRGQRVA